MTRPKAVIIGAGLGGCMLASALLETHDVTIVERGEQTIDPRFPLVDIGLPARNESHFGAGLGGSTQLWHNGLIEIDQAVFEAHWPIPKSALDPYYEQAFPLLSGIPLSQIRTAIAILRSKYGALGLPADDLPGLYYPRWPLNVWDSLKLDGRVTLVRGDVRGFQMDTAGTVAAVTIAADDQQQSICADVFVLSAGGLVTPVLLQKLAASSDLPSLRHAGCHYEDHPMGFVGEVELKIPVYRLWNYHVPGTGGNLRLPLLVNIHGMDVSFQLRPAAAFYRDSRRQRVTSVLHNLRHQPWNPLNYIKLLSHWDDMFDILSFKLGIRLPTKRYTLLMMAQMPAGDERSIWSDTDPASGKERRVRNWTFTEAYRADLHAAVAAVLERLGPVTRSARIFPDWLPALATGAHHSGTARMAASASDGVCDGDCRVHGTANLYVCDGSVIPASGVANTGLTISALALRLANYLGRHSARTIPDSEGNQLP